MAWPDPGRTATWDKTANTMGRSVDSVLWPMLCAKSQLIDRVAKESVDNTKYEWETANTVGRTFTAGGGTDLNGSASAARLDTATVGLVAGQVQVGAIIRNASRATPIGTYGQDEIMMVSVVSGAQLTVIRNYANVIGGTAANGSTIHGNTDSYEILWTPKEEGSSPDANKYKDVSLVANYTTILDFYLTVTGSQLASKRLVAGDTLQRQFDDRLVELQNDIESMFLYGALNSGTAAVGAGTEANAWAGTDAYPRTTQGLMKFLAVSGGNVDYSTLSVTETAINGLFMTLLTNGVDMSDNFILVTHPANIRTINAFGSDKVRITQAETKWGRALKTFETDLGVEVELVPCINCSKSNLFVIDTKKVKLAEFRPFQKFEWGIDTSSPDGTDAWKQRYLGEYGVKVVDGAKSHGMLTKIGGATATF
jgi:hypothetical protein